MNKNMTLKDKFQELINNQTFMVCTFLTIVYLLSGYWKWIEIAIPIIALIFFIKYSMQSSFCVYMYLHCFTLSNIGYESCLLATTVCFTIVMIVKYIIGVKKGVYAINKKILIALSIFMVISILISLPNKFYRGAWMYLTYFPLFYLFFVMRKEFNVDQSMKYMFTGLLTSSVLAVIYSLMPGFQYEVMYEGSRFLAFTNHPNYFYVRALFCLVYYTYLLIDNRLKPLTYLFIYGLSTVLVLSTLSKTGIILLAAFTVFAIILYLLKDFKKRIKHVGIFALILVVILLACHNYIKDIFLRFTSENEYFNDDAINSLTTGRDDIWLDYLKQCVKNPFALLFGNGLLTQEAFIYAQNETRAAHSLYIFLLYRFGIVGILAICYIIYLMVKSLNKEKPKFIAYLPLLFILGISLTENTFKSFNFTYFILAAQILFSMCNLKQAKKVNTEVKETETATIKNNNNEQI